MSNYVVFDFETTGLDTSKDEVLQLSAIKYIDGQKHSYNAFVQGIPVPEIITKITGINDQLIKEKGVSKQQAWAEFYDFVGKDHPMIGHNIINFDRFFMDRFFQEFGYPLVDTSRYIDTAMIYKGMKIKERQKGTESHFDFCRRVGAIRAFGVRYTLSISCAECGIDTSAFTAHQSDSDVEMTDLLYRHLVGNQLKLF